jgi:hypothetical protein
MYLPTHVDPKNRDELQRVSAAFTKLEQNIVPNAAREPERPRSGMLLLCDGVNWDPLGNGISQPVIYDGAAWIPLGAAAAASTNLMDWFLS